MKGIIFRPGIFLMSVFVGLWLAGCDKPEPIPLEKTPEEEAQRSGGLGLHLPAFEIHHGKTEICGEVKSLHHPCLRQDKVRVHITRMPQEERIIDFMFKFNHGTNLAQMRETVRAFLPADSRLIKTYSAERGLETVESLYDLPVDLYHSAWLEQRIPESARRGILGMLGMRTKQGKFYVFYGEHGAFMRLGERAQR